MIKFAEEALAYLIHVGMFKQSSTVITTNLSSQSILIKCTATIVLGTHQKYETMFQNFRSPVRHYNH